MFIRCSLLYCDWLRAATATDASISDKWGCYWRLLGARSRQKPPRGEASRFVKKDRKWHISPPLSYREDRTPPPGKTLISRKEKARLEALVAQVPSAVAASRSAAGRAAPPAATTDTTRPEAKTPAEIINDAMKLPAEAAVWMAKSDYPYEAKVAIAGRLSRASSEIAGSAKGSSRTRSLLSLPHSARSSTMPSAAFSLTPHLRSRPCEQSQV